MTDSEHETEAARADRVATIFANRRKAVLDNTLTKIITRATDALIQSEASKRNAVQEIAVLVSGCLDTLEF